MDGMNSCTGTTRWLCTEGKKILMVLPSGQSIVKGFDLDFLLLSE